MIEYLDQLGHEEDAELWLVRRDGMLATAHVYHDHDRTWREQVATQSRQWIGFEHPHVSPLFEITDDEQLIIITGDERGPNPLKMVAELDDAAARETWALSEIAGIAEAIATMQWRRKGLVYRRIDPLNMFVGVDGHVRLRAPIEEVSVGPQRNYVGRGKVFRGLEWMSPELVLGLPLTQASDVFQLASVTYTAVAGKRPFGGVTELEKLLEIKNAVAPPPPRTAMTGVADLIVRNLARDPDKRMQTPALFAAALRALVREASSDVVAKVAARRGDTRPPPNRSATIVGGRCHKQWNELTPTAADGVRHCASCNSEVVQVRSVGALVPLLGKRCISYEPE